MGFAAAPERRGGVLPKTCHHIKRKRDVVLSISEGGKKLPEQTLNMDSQRHCSFKVTILASLPTEPYIHPWHDPSYRISHNPYAPTMLRRNDPRIQGQVFPVFQRNFTRRRGETEFPNGPYGLQSQERWYQFEQRSGSFQDNRQEFPSLYQSELETGAQLFYRRSSESTSGNEYLGSGAPNLGNAYSSHVNCQVPNQNKGMTKMSKEIRDNIEPIFGSEAVGKVDERINFQEASRSSRNDDYESEIPNPRIVTPKGGRRPTHGNPQKTQNKPLSSVPTNTISTTEKSFRNQTAKLPKRPRPSSAKPQGGDIVFPDGYPKKFVPRVSKCAKKMTFCEHLGEEYPSEYINQVLKKEGAMFREFFGKDMISDPNITERINAPEENSLCPYRQEVVFPRAAQNKEDKWLFIINQDQYVQGVTVEVCLNPESRCILTEGFPLGYTPYCKQKYIERRLVAIGEDGKPHSDSFRLPSCCSCVVKHESAARMRLRSSRAAVHSPTQP